MLSSNPRPRALSLSLSLVVMGFSISLSGGGTLTTSKKVVPLIGTSVTLLSALSFASMFVPPLVCSWLAVAMPVISSPFLCSVLLGNSFVCFVLFSSVW